MMSYSSNNSISDQETANNATTSAGNCCSRASSELKLYQAFIFSVPVFFTFILLFLFYLFYLRRRRADWSSLRMRTSNSLPSSGSNGDISRCEMGLKKELREMLPIIVFKESFSVKDTQCSVCLGDYQADDRLQQIPACAHTFHMDCIDLWLSTQSTCPLCRQSLLLPCPHGVPDPNVETINRMIGGQNGDETSNNHNSLQSNEDPQTSRQPSEPWHGDERVILAAGERNRNLLYNQVEGDMEMVKNETVDLKMSCTL